MSKRGTQRTRGNLKPSSSTKASATLLTHGTSPFVLFSGELPISNGIDEYGIDNDMDSDLRVILRKLLKKDSTTKIRAFDELRDYCDANDSDDKIRAILPYFVLHYRKWSTDCDQRVRDECQSTFDTIGMRVKKNLSPHLKAILPVWLMAQCDSYAPAASKAKFLYTKLFNGENKQAEAVYFVRNEIMSTLTDEINQCSDVLKDKKENEMETDDAHERRLTQALLALAVFLNYFEAEKRSELTSHFKTIFDSGKFWKLDKIKSIQIQSSFHRCLDELINLIPDVMREYKTKIIPLVFYSINETEPKLCPLIWDCLILCLDTFDDCWSLVNYQKAFLPKLYAFLRGACHGNVFGVKDCLLPLITKIPKAVIEDKTTYRFVENFFQSMEEGILSIKGRQQMNNVNSLLKAYMDCLLYILEHHTIDQLDFLNERLLPMIRHFLIDKDCSIRNAYARQYVHILSLIESFHLYREHLNSVLSLFRDLITQPLSTSNESNDLKYVFEQAGILFETILFPPKLKNLRFAATTIITSSSTDLSSIDSTTFQTEDDDEIANNNQKETYLTQFATDLCQYCFQFCIEHPNHAAFEHSLDLFTRLLNSSTTTNTDIITKLTETNDKTKTIPEMFYLTYAKPLITIVIEQHSSLDHIVELTIQILNIFDSSEMIVENVLADLIKLESSRRFYFLLASIVCRYESSPSFHIWLQTHGVLEQLLNMTANVPKSSETHDLNFPVSTEEFQLLSSLLCSSKPTQFLTSIQQEQIVYLACRLLEQQTPSLNDSDTQHDLIQSIDHVAKHLFQNIDKTYANQSTKNLFELYIHNDISNLIRKNVELSLHQRSIWLIAIKQSHTTNSHEIYQQLIQIILSYIPTQSENDIFIDMIISICQDETSLSEKLYSQLCQRISLDNDLIYESWIYGILHGWLLPDQTIEMKFSNKNFSEYERFLDVHFICLLIIRQYELNSYLWSNDQLIKTSILYYYLFQYRCIDAKSLYNLFERLFHLSTFRIEFHLAEKSSLAKEFYAELIYYHFYCQIKDKYLNINQRDDCIHYTLTLNHNDEFNSHLILACFLRESQLKLLVPYLIEQCQDEHRSELTLAALNQSLLRMNKLGLIFDENYLNSILDILMKSSSSSKESLQLIQLWNTLLNHGTFAYSLQQDHWDKVLCLLSNLFQNLTNIQQQMQRELTLRTEFLFIHAANLLTTVGNLLTNHNKQEENETMNKQLLDEWLLLYSKEIYQGLLPLYIALPSALAEFSAFHVTNEMVKSICCAICTIPTDYLLSNNLKPLFHAEDNQSTLSEPIQTVFNHLYRLLCLTPNRSLQYSAYHLLNKLLLHISSSLIRTANNEDIAEDNKICQLLGSMTEALQRTENTIGQWLTENDIVEEHLLDDNGHEMISQSSPTTVKTDKEHVIIGELLNYKLLLNLINCYSLVEQRYTYTLMLQEKKLVDRFLSIVLGLIPANPVYNDPLSMQVSSITKKLTHSKSMFENDIQLTPSGDLNSQYTIPHLACSVYFQCLSLIPALVREWHHNQAKRIRDAVDRVTQKYVSPILIQQELDSASSLKEVNVGETGLFTVKKHSNTREITAIYNIETSRVEICIRLPMNYPLTIANIECTHHVGFTKDQWNKWMLQLKTNLTQNNGAIADGLLHWKRNIDKMMQGIEECSICYCILHTNNELPKRTCRTCKKKFHDACLFRWFRSSNKSTCPHCRSNF